MKKLVIFMLMVACITISGCGDKTIVGDSVSSPTQQTSDTSGQTSISPEVSAPVELESTPVVEVGSSPTMSTIENNVKQILLTDFIVSDGINSVELYKAFKDFKTDIPEEKIDNNYVGETYSGDAVYKTYIHKYSDFDLYVSNLNYDINNKSFDEYNITQITLKGSKFKTARGISIGSKLSDVLDVYGSGEKSTVEGKETLSYKCEDMELSFTIDENQMVQEVVLMVKAQNS